MTRQYALKEVENKWCVTEWRTDFESPQVIALCPNLQVAETVRDAMEAAELLRTSAFQLKCAIKLSNGDRLERV